jgi:hypothetical protein
MGSLLACCWLVIGLFFFYFVAHNAKAGISRLWFAVIRQFRAESVIEISWLRFGDSIALFMCF